MSIRLSLCPAGLFAGLLLLAGCSQQPVETAKTEPAAPTASEAPANPALPAEKPLPVVAAGVLADQIIVDKSDRLLMLFDDGREIARYGNIRFGDAPEGHKRFEGDERTPEGTYIIDGRNPGSRYTLSLRVSYPNAADRAFAAARNKPPGGDIFIHGQPTGYTGPPIAHDWTDGCIAVSNAEIRQIWALVPDGAVITIRP